MKLLTIFLSSCVLVACGGGDSAAPLIIPTYTVSATVVGLAATESVVL